MPVVSDAPAGRLYIGWLLLVVIVFIYNCWMVPYRAFFLYGRQGQQLKRGLPILQG